MRVKRLKEIINVLDDNLEVFVRNTVNICGNIQELDQVEKSTYGFFGETLPCVILNTDYSKEMALNENDEIIDFISEEIVELIK